MLTDEEKEYYKFAELIANGEYSFIAVFETFAHYPDTAAKIVDFWMRCDEFTQNVAHTLAVEKARIRLEVCADCEMDEFDIFKHNFAIFKDNLKRGLKKWMTKTKRKKI